MRIILHADDFGYDSDTVKQTINCFDKGFLTSASIMANLPETNKAIEFARLHPQYSFGVHLAYVDGIQPLSETGKILSLITKKNVFKPSHQIRIQSLLNLLKKKEIIEETRRQLLYVLDKGVKVSHVDSHGHIHKFPVFQEAISEVLQELKIEKVRKVQDVFLEREFIAPGNRIYKLFDRGIKKRFKTTDYFYMPATSGDSNWSDKLLKVTEKLSDEKVLEIGVHPGLTDTWRKNELTDIEIFKITLANTHHSLINWNEF